MNPSDIKKFLQENVKLFADFPEDRLQKIAENSGVRTFEEHEGIMHFGEKENFLGILLEGQAKASVTRNTGKQSFLYHFNPGALINLVPMMTGETNLTDVIAVQRCKMLMIHEDLFTSLIITHLPTVQKISKIIGKMIQKFTLDDKGRDLAEKAFGKEKDPYGLKLFHKEPIKIFVINCGYTTLGYNLYNTADESLNVAGRIIFIGSDNARHICTYKGEKIDEMIGKCDHNDAFKFIFELITSKSKGVINSPHDIVLVGHRVVHGGVEFNAPTVIDETVIDKIDQLSSFASLHNPYNLIGIQKGMEFFTDALHVAVFDTAFHQSLPPYAYLYGLPYKYYEKSAIRRYGFHGMSHGYVSLKAAEVLQQPYSKLEIVTCHLGNTASLCAVDHGRSIDTTMGMSPTEGLLMGNRCGDIDASAVLKIMHDDNLSIEEMHTLLNKDGGLRGISGISNNMRELIIAADQGDHQAMLAFKTFCYKVRKYIGSYIAAMEGIDILVFTGMTGVENANVRSIACQGLQCMGIVIDEEKNRNVTGKEEYAIISSEESTISVMVIPTDEERMIARDALKTMNYRASEIVLKQQHVPIPIEVSAHHVHLSKDHVEALFGKNHQLTPLADLSQPGQFACKETVTLVGPKGNVERVRVLGPARNLTQVEIAMTEQFQLGVEAPLRASGNIKNTPGIILRGDKGEIEIEEGVICAFRHIHMTPDDAQQFGLQNHDMVRVKISSERELIFGDVLVRVHPTYKLAMHIDTDEANAANLQTGVIGNIIEIQSRI